MTPWVAHRPATAASPIVPPIGMHRWQGRLSSTAVDGCAFQVTGMATAFMKTAAARRLDALEPQYDNHQSPRLQQASHTRDDGAISGIKKAAQPSCCLTRLLPTKRPTTSIWTLNSTPAQDPSDRTWNHRRSSSNDAPDCQYAAHHHPLESLR